MLGDLDGGDVKGALLGDLKVGVTTGELLGNLDGGIVTGGLLGALEVGRMLDSILGDFDGEALVGAAEGRRPVYNAVISLSDKAAP